MPHNATHIEEYRFSSKDKLFLDANIWLFLYGPKSHGNRNVQTYSRAFRRILEASSRIYIDVLVISEFINCYARETWKKTRSDAQGESFKKFRSSQEFIPVAQEIADNTRHVLKYCSRIGSHFEELNMDFLVGEYSEGNADFNDQVISNLCMSRELKLITHDSDFRNKAIPVITANARLLN